VGDNAAQLVDLSEPRDLSAEERLLLDFILAGPNVRRELRTQGDSAEVLSACDCGCRSVGLRPDPTVPDAPYTAEDSYVGRDDYIGLTADGLSAAGTDVEVTLHVIFGRMTELEIWDGSDRGGESRGELPDVATLRYREQV
jgi:hypothetical protein